MGNTFNIPILWIGYNFRQNVFRETELFDYAHMGSWPALILRAVTHPHEARWRDRYYNTALHLICRRQPPIDAVLALIRAYPQSTSIQTVDGMTPLHFACYCSSSLMVIQMLIDACPEAVSLKDKKGRTPLTCACAGYRTDDTNDIIQALLEVDPNSSLIADEMGRTPLSLIFDDYAEELDESLDGENNFAQDVPIFNGILNGGNEFGRDQNDVNVLRPQNRDDLTVGSNSHSEDLDQCWICIKLLLKAAYHGTVAKSLLSNDTFRIVHASVGVSECPPNIIRLALKRKPEQVQQKDISGNYPLHIAAECHRKPTRRSCDRTNYDVIQALLEIYPYAAQCQRLDGKFPLSLAINNGKTWDGGVKAILKAFPEALATLEIDVRVYPIILERVGKDCDITILYKILLQTVPEVVGQ